MLRHILVDVHALSFGFLNGFKTCLPRLLNLIDNLVYFFLVTVEFTASCRAQINSKSVGTCTTFVQVRKLAGIFQHPHVDK